MSKKVALELQACCGQRSGIGIYTYELASRLKNFEDCEICGTIFNFMGRNDNSEALSGIECPINVNNLMPYGVYRRIWDYVPLRYARLFPVQADITHFFNYIVPPNVDGKIITTVYDMTYLRFPETLDEKNLKRLNKGMNNSVERSDIVVTISEFSKREIIDLLGLPEDKVRVVPCAASGVEPSVPYERIRAKFGLKKPYVLFLGNTEPRKNLSRLLDAFKLLKSDYPNAQLVLAGGGGWKSENIAMEAQRTQDVVLTGYVSGAEKSALFENAAVFAFPSVYEGFGIPILEAMGHGVPVVCSDVASMPEVAGDAARYVNAMDADSIAQGLYDILTDREFADSLVLRGGEQIKKYSWEKSVEKLTEIYRSLA